MKLFSLKKSLAVLITLALTVSIFGASYVTSAESNTNWQEATLDLSDKMNADNWNILEGDTDTLNSSKLPLIKYGESYATLSMTNSSQKTIGRISPKLPENARILEFSYDVYTKAESHHKPLALIYSFTDIDNYSAIGLCNYIKLSKVTCTSGNDSYSNWWTTSSTANISKWNVKISYTYNEDETVSCKVVVTSKNDSTLTQSLSATNVKPAAVLSGGSTLATNMTNTFGEYTNVSVKYAVEIKSDAQVEAFKTENPLPVDDITNANAIKNGRQANSVIEAINALTDENLKSALADYEAEAKAIVTAANASITNAELVAPEMQGASIVKTDKIDKQDLRFEATFDTTAAVTSGYTPVEYGMILMTKAKMPVNNLLEMTSVGKGALPIIIASAEVSEGGTVPSTFYVELSGSGAANADGAFDSTTIVGKRFYARAYIAYENAAGEKFYAYSDNDIENKIENGQAGKSIIGVAKAIAAQQIANGASDTDGSIQAIIDASSTNSETRQTLLQFVCDNQSYLNN